MRFTRIVATTLGVLALALMSVSVASAAPTKSKNAGTVDIVCDNGQSYTVAVNGRGDFTPGHIIEGGRGNLIPVAFTFTSTFEGQTFTESIEKPGQRNGFDEDDLIECAFGGTFTEDGETFTFSGTVTGFLTPRNR